MEEEGGLGEHMRKASCRRGGEGGQGEGWDAQTRRYVQSDGPPGVISYHFSLCLFVSPSLPPSLFLPLSELNPFAISIPNSKAH